MIASRRTALTAAAGAAILLTGAGLGAGLDASLSPSTTTTVVTATARPQAAAPVALAPSDGKTINGIYQRSYRAVVDVTIESTIQGPGGSRTTGSEGTGFVYDSRGDIVTAEHVVSGERSIAVTFANGQTVPARLLGSDPSTDVAVIRVTAPPANLDTLPLGNSDALQVGDPVIAIGSPFGLPETVTSGIVSALHRSIDSPNHFTIGDSIQTDAAINHGNSGGPLLNGDGQVIGLIDQIQSASGGSDGVGFAVPSNTIAPVVEEIIAGKKVTHAYFGVEVQDSTTPPGADLATVVAGMPAAKAGLKAGDVVVALDGTPVRNESDLSVVIGSKSPGDRMAVTYVRAGVRATVTVTLTTRPS